MNIKNFFLKVCNKIDVKFFFPLLAKSRKNKLKYTDFTIISNNCWAGKCYEYFNLPKSSPTIGGYFFAEDYVKFCKNIKHYLSCNLDIIPASESKHYKVLLEKNEENSLIGKLDDVEIIFLHYHDKKILIEKWNRRVERINWDRLILKFSYQNECSDELIKSFLEISDFPKFCLVGKKNTDSQSACNRLQDIQELFNNYSTTLLCVEDCLVTSSKDRLDTEAFMKKMFPNKSKFEK